VIDGRQTDFVGTGYDLSDVITSMVFIDLDWRYGFCTVIQRRSPASGHAGSTGWSTGGE